MMRLLSRKNLQKHDKNPLRGSRSMQPVFPEPDEPSRNQIAKPEKDERGLGKIARLTSFPTPASVTGAGVVLSACHLTQAWAGLTGS
jgi:hypothetical protein